LFIQVIPFFIIVLSDNFINYFNNDRKEKLNISLLVNVLLLSVFVTGQFYYRLQFLVTTKELFGLVISLNIVSLIFIYFRRFKVSVIFVVLSMLFWSLSCIYSHIYIYKSIKQASEKYAIQQYSLVIHNDVSSVAAWYFRGREHYCDFNSKIKTLTKCLEKVPAQLVVVTNEHNPDMTFDGSKFPQLQFLEEFSYTLDNKTFFTKVFKVL
jgi:hypothetical protein